MKQHSVAGPAVSLLLMALLAGVALWNLVSIETLHREAGRIVELGAEQQAMAQRILADCSELVVPHEATDTGHLTAELRDALSLMENSHRLLTSDSGPVPELFANSAALHAMYFEPPNKLDDRVLDFIATARTFLANPEDAPTMTAELGHLQRLARNHLAMGLLRASRLYREALARRALRLRRTGMGVIAALLALLAISGKLVFLPLTRRLDSSREAVARLTSQLEECAVVDQITRVPNRRRMEEVLAREVQHSIRYDCKLVCMFVRIEDFRDINEEYGPDAGDRLLAEMALLLKNNLRITDYLFRYGGPVFAVLAPNTDEEGAAIMADKIARLSGTNRFHRRIPLRVRTAHARYACGEPEEAFLKRALACLDDEDASLPEGECTSSAAS